LAAPAATTAATAPPQATQGALTRPRVRVSERPYYEDDMRRWARIVALCRDNHVRLLAALSPLSPEMFAAIDPADAEAVAERIGEVAPVWDFSSPHEPTNTPGLWWSPRHYHHEVADFMLGRIYGTEVPDEWRNFGHVRAARGRRRSASCKGRARALEPSVSRSSPGEMVDAERHTLYQSQSIRPGNGAFARPYCR